MVKSYYLEVFSGILLCTLEVGENILQGKVIFSWKYQGITYIGIAGNMKGDPTRLLLYRFSMKL
ncbi:hypothetical protein MYP_2668 [Sporocytophaga myxococcoides]|uniref:Uncharacterized protein n=1 Tax=Sporocytophaga myxococcoides TaxID=153721 RepID=A0A098LG52_9BACT|nr:hypothetical protein MYP_2668 [Sporocytophaga myxococcoides]